MATAQVTDYGVGLLNANTGPIVLELFKLGSASSYIPLPGDTDIHGVEVFHGAPSSPVVSNANVMKYSIYVDYPAPAFSFGEVGLYHDNQLFALCAFSTLVDKIAPSGSVLGNSVRIDIYLSMVGTNYDMWLDLSESNNAFRLASIDSVDRLPPSHAATPNSYIVQGADENQVSTIAYTDRNGLWNFDAYQYSTILGATIVAADNISVTISLNDYSTNMIPDYFGSVILEFSTGQLYSICRYVKTVAVSGNKATLGFNTQMLIVPAVGDKFVLFRRQSQATSLPQLPIATSTTLGGVKIGFGMTIDIDGRLNVNPAALGIVTSVNTLKGDVIINAANLPNLATVGKTGSYNDLVNKPPAYVLPTMTAAARGGARLPTNNNLVLTGGDVLDLGFPPIKTINNALPDILGNINVADTLEGLINPQEIVALTDLDTMRTTGLFYALGTTSVINKPISTGDAVLEVIRSNAAATPDVVQRWTIGDYMWWRKITAGTWGPWNQVMSDNVTSIASATKLGVIRVGANLSIDADGILSATGGGGPGAGVDSFNTRTGAVTLTLLDVTTALGFTPEDASKKAQPGGYASLDGAGLIPTSQLPPNAVISVNAKTGVVVLGVADIVGAAPLDSPAFINNPTAPTRITSDNSDALATTKYVKAAIAAAGGGGGGSAVTSVNTLIGDVILTTDNIAEGTTNLYFTTARAAAASPVQSFNTRFGAITLTLADVTAALAYTPVNKAGDTMTGDLNFNNTSAKFAKMLGCYNGLNSLGTVSTGTATLDFALGAQQLQVSGTVSIATTNWAATGTECSMLLALINGGSATLTWPAINWIKSDGTVTTVFASNGVTLQVAGTDFVLLWSLDGGTTIYGKIIR